MARAWRARCLILALLAVSQLGCALSPVVIVPGDGSNQLEAKLDKATSPHFYCSTKADWFRLWLNLEILVPGVIDCWCDNIRLVVNNSTGAASNVPGVEVRVPGWGSTEGLEELDPTIGSSTAAFYYMVQALQEAGYEKNVTLRGAPYDFRYTPDSDLAYGVALKALIEETSKATGEAVTLISHSMGGLQTLYFLNQQTKAWKSQYIRHWIAISAPWIGAAKEMRLFATGDSEGLPVSANTIRGEQRSYETNHWLFPNAAAGFQSVIVRTDKRNYTAADYEDFFDDIGYSVGKLVLPRVLKLIPDPLTGPGVPVTCMYSHGVKTPAQFVYKDDFDTTPEEIDGDGDGTVNIDSLSVCAQWASTQNETVSTMTFDGVDHTGMITNATSIASVVKILKSLASVKN